ncbi:MAG: LamG-like jellyroll fold domain-containing protein [Planctomycetota bacterium]|jgi:hypothetical protein
MCRRLFYLISLVFVLSLMGGVCRAADPVGWWKFDDGSGTTALDSSGNGNHGEIHGGTEWIDGYHGGALRLNGQDGYVNLPIGAVIASMDSTTIATWVDFSNAGGSWQRIFDFGSGSSTYLFLCPRTGTAGPMHLAIQVGGQGHSEVNSPETLPTGWHHVAAVITSGSMQLYLDGLVIGSSTAVTMPSDLGNTSSNWLGRSQFAADGYFNGSLDDFRIYNEALSQEEIQLAMEGEEYPYASRPDPADGSLLADFPGSVLGKYFRWTAGDTAASHDVYFGTNYADVEAGTGGTLLGNQTDTYLLVGYGYTPTDPLPDGLVPGTTYYWRVDEVEVNGVTKHTGNIWSVKIAPAKAYEPTPVDGADFIDSDSDLSWVSGMGIIEQTLYFDTDYDTVKNATTGGHLVQDATTYDPSPLELNTVYYWRVDTTGIYGEFKGDVWSFETLPDVPVTDPNLLGWWKFDEGSGTTAVDWSGQGNHGEIRGGTEWIDGYDGGALRLKGQDGYVNLPIGAVIASMDSTTITMWVNFSNAGGSWQRIFDFGSGTSTYIFLCPRTGDANQMRLAIQIGGQGYSEINTPETLPTGWHHVAVVIKSGSMQLYLDGLDIASGSAETVPSDLGNTSSNWLGRSQFVADGYFNGSLDDFRIYNFAMTAGEIPQTMRGDTRLAWEPSPANGSTPDIEAATLLTWSPGDDATQHDIYFGTDENAVDNADISDTTGIYRGRRPETSFTPDEGVEWGTGPYYWRIDEYNTDGIIIKGRIWSFTVADFLSVDDFEDYNVTDKQIWAIWHDGLGYWDLDGVFHPGNGTGSAVGDEENDNSYMEETIVRPDSTMSMPYFYNNNDPTKAKYSEAKMTLSDQRDWTEEGVNALSLWFQGYSASVGSFADNLDGTYTMTGSGADIWGNSDQFHFAYKPLSGAGSIIARVDSVQNTDGSAKGGVMIRDTLDPNSAHAMIVLTPSNDVRFERRPIAADASQGDTVTGTTAPHWVRLDRDITSNFTAYHSTDGSMWEVVGPVQNIAMGPNVFVGLVVTSHNAALTCQVEFSNVQVDVSGPWLNQDIGIQSNDPERMYVAVANSNGTTGTVYYEDNDNIVTDATQIDTWTEWNVDLKDFQDQGVNLADVNSVAIGIGTRGGTTPGGEGKMYFDDIRLYRPRYVPGKGTPLEADFNGDGVVDYRDFETMADDWLEQDQIITTVDPTTANLVAYYALDEGAGTVAGDSAGSHNGTVVGGAQWIAGPDGFGSALMFDGNPREPVSSRSLSGPTGMVSVVFGRV